MSKPRTITKSVLKTALVLASSSLLSLSFMYPVSVHAADVWNLDTVNSNIYNTNTQNVGVGLTNPSQKLSVRGGPSGVASFSDGTTYPCCSSYYTVSINELGTNHPTLQFHDDGVAEGQIILTNNTGYGQRGFNFQSTQAPASGKFTGDIISESATNAVLRLVKTGTTTEQFKIYNAGGGSNIVSDKALYMYAGDGSGVNGVGNMVLVGANTFFNNSAGVSKAKISTNGGTTYFIDGPVGVGTSTPDSTAKLDVSGKLKTGTFQITSGATAGKVLTSDANGNATWQAPVSGSSTNVLAGNSINVTTVGNNATVKVADGGITSVQIADKSVGETKFSSGALASGYVLKTNGLGSAAWSTNVNSVSTQSPLVTTNSIGDISLSLADGGITTSKVADSAITPAKISSNAATNGQVLSFSNGNFQWVNQSSGGLFDGNNLVNNTVNFNKLSATNPLAGQVLGFNGSNLVWVNQASGGTSSSPQWAVDGAGIHYDQNVGVGVSSDPNYKLTVRGKLNVEGTDLVLGRYDGRDSGTKTENRALVHDLGDKLVINYAQDFEGGVYIDGNTKIAGELKVKKIIVTPDVNADYVFKPGYQMKTLAEVEKYIKENGHLPGVPDDKEVYSNGIELSRGYTILLEKVEELHLRAIDQEKRIDKQQSQIDQLIEQNKLLMEKLSK